MDIALKNGTVLGVLLATWYGLATSWGWHANPDSHGLIWVAISLQFLVLGVILGQTRQGRGFKEQFGLGVVASAIAGIAVFLGWAVITTRMFPAFFDQLNTMHAEVLHLQGHSRAAIDEALARSAAARTPTGQAFAGLMSTLGVGLVSSAVLATFIRTRAANASAPEVA